MNAKSLLFVFALLALFTLASTKAIEEKSKRDLEDDELLSDALSLMQKLLKSKEAKEKQRITESLNTEDVAVEEETKDEIEAPVAEEEPAADEQINVAGPEEKYIVGDVAEEQPGDQNNENIGPDFEEVEVITVTVEVEEGTQIYSIDAGNDDGENVEENQDAEEAEGDVVEGEDGEQVEVGVIDEQPELNLDLGKNVVDVAVDGEDVLPEEEVLGSVSYDVKEEELDGNGEEVTYYYEVNEGEYDENDDTYNGVIADVSTEDKKKGSKTGVIGASVAVLGAFGVVAGFGYKYTQRNKRVLLPFHEDLLEKGEFFDKNSAEQHIIPVWAAAKKEENEEEKEDEEKLFEVVYNYEPELPDELKLTVGDKIKIKEIYEDGWAYGYNKTTQLFGTFPSTSLGENFNPESVPQYKPEEVAVEMNDNMVEELKKKIVESN